MKKHERAQSVVRYLAKKLGRNQYEIGQMIGYMNKSSFSMLLNGKTSFPDNIPERLAALDPTINVEFLRGTSDRMLLGDGEQPLFVSTDPDQVQQEPEPQKQPVPMGVFIPGELVRIMTDLGATIRSQQETIRLLVSARSWEKVEKAEDAAVS